MTLRPGRPSPQALRTAGALSSVGLAFVVAVALGAWFGWLLDGWIGTSPWFFLIGFFLGVVAGGLNVYRITARLLR